MGMAALLLACVMATALLTAGPASAASRGFKIHNNSRHALRLETAKAVPTYTCINLALCVPNHYPMAFEGRPHDGAVMNPGNTQVWELKYGFSLLGGVQYAANAWYKVEGTPGTVEYTLETWSTSNESACKVIPADVGHCTAEGLHLTFRNH